MKIEKILKKIDKSKIDKCIERKRLYSNGIHRLNTTIKMLEERQYALEEEIDKSKYIGIYSRLINGNDVLKLEISDNEMYNNAIVILSISKDRVLNYINEEFIKLIGIKDCNFTSCSINPISIIYPEISNTPIRYQLTTSGNKLQLVYDIGGSYKYLVGFRKHITYFSSAEIHYDDDNTIFNHGDNGKVIYEPDEEVIKIENEKIKTMLEGIDNADTDDTKNKE